MGVIRLLARAIEDDWVNSAFFGEGERSCTQEGRNRIWFVVGVERAGPLSLNSGAMRHVSRVTC